MPEIVPIEQMGTITATTQSPSAKLAAAPVAAVPVAPPKEEPAKTEAPRNIQDTRLAALTKKEQAIQREKRALQAERRAMEEKYSQVKPWEEAASLAKTNKLQAIEKLGITYDDLTNLALNQNPTSPEELAESRAAALVKKEIDLLRAENQKNQEQQQLLALTNARKQISSESRTLAETSPDFPLVKALKGFDTVTEFVEQTYYDTGKLIPVEEATREYESFVRNEVLELAKTDPKILEALTSAPKQAVPQAATNTQKPQTLTHKTTVAPPASKPLTPAEKRQRAIDVFYGRVS